MSFKRDNPGSPCCTCCPCYKLDGNGKSATGPHNLTETNASYAAGIMGQAAEFTGLQHYHRTGVDCFSPSEVPVWSMWFWIKEITEPTSPSPGVFHGVVTKGQLNGNPGTAGAPPTSFDGEWGVFYRPPISSANNMFFVYRSNPIIFGLLGTDGIAENKWHFFHWTINHTTKQTDIVRYREGSTSAFVVCAELGCTSTPNIVGNMSKSTELLRIGNNTGTNGVTLGSNSGSFLIDNVGFSDRPSSASDLYNSGSGKPCPNIG